MRERIRRYLEDKEDTSPSFPCLVGDEVDLDEAWHFFTWMEALDWKFLPCVGGLQDQDIIIMDNVFSIKAAVERLKKQNG